MENDLKLIFIIEAQIKKKSTFRLKIDYLIIKKKIQIKMPKDFQEYRSNPIHFANPTQKDENLDPNIYRSLAVVKEIRFFLAIFHLISFL